MRRGAPDVKATKQDVMNAPVVLGIDPGGKRCGLVTRRGDELLGWHLIERGGQTPSGWTETVVSYIDEARREHQPNIIAVEDVNDPTPHLGIIQITWLLHTARVIGGIVIAAPDAVVVSPGGFSKIAQQPRRLLEQLFPAQLVSTPLARLKDVRSAWLIAEAAVRQQRINAVA